MLCLSLFVMLMATSYLREASMSKVIKFEGQEYSFPDDATDGEMSVALSKLNVQTKSTEPQSNKEDEAAFEETYFAQPSDSGDKQFSGREVVKTDNPVPERKTNDSNRKTNESTAAPTVQGRVSQFEQEPLNEDQRVFRDKIVKIESGGLSQPYARTGIAPKKRKVGDKPRTGDGSSAYGPAQITRGLMVNYLANKGKMFTDSEVQAMLEMVDRQKVSLIIGGNDRADYSAGGTHAAYGEFMADAYGYETTEEFLDAFDYGGDLGLSEDRKFKLQYENFSRKMLKDTLKEAKGDQLLAASVWHGGSKWKTAKSKGDTKLYREKFNRL